MKRDKINGALIQKVNNWDVVLFRLFWYTAFYHFARSLTKIVLGESRVSAAMLGLFSVNPERVLLK